MPTKTEVNKIKAKKKKIDRKIAVLKKKEEAVRKKWTRLFRAHKKASLDLATLKRRDTKKWQAVVKKVQDFDEKSDILTLERDRLREEIRLEEKKLISEEFELLKMSEQIKAKMEADDEIVDQVFALSMKVKEALLARQKYLEGPVYRELDEEGGNVTRVTFTHSDGCTQVIARVNTRVKLEDDMAREAMRLYQIFLDKYRPVAVDDFTKMFVDIGNEMLINEGKFKIGKAFYLFIGLKINSSMFPDLARSQELLRDSIRSEQSNKYVRLYERKNEKSPWQQVKIS